MLRLLPTYLTAAEMADRLYVTPNTVRTQIQALYGKLGRDVEGGGRRGRDRDRAARAAAGPRARAGSPASEDAPSRPAR